MVSGRTAARHDARAAPARRPIGGARHEGDGRVRGAASRPTALTPGDVEALLADRAIIRNRAKIEATVHNARLIASGAPFASLTGPASARGIWPRRAEQP